MSDTKDHICEVAVSLFNERGYENVSLRDIAAEAGIAIGTLTYHFTKKEDLLIRLLTDLHEYMPEVLARSEASDAGVEECLRGMVGVFLRSQEHLERYRYYFENVDSIVKSSPELLQEDVDFEKMLFDYYVSEFMYLKELGALRGAVGEALVEQVAMAMIDLHVSWLLSASPANNPKLPGVKLGSVLATQVSLLLGDEAGVLFEGIRKEAVLS